MDPLTQAGLGGAIGAAFFHRTLGRRAVLFGALVGMSPDLDVVASLWTDEWGSLAAHRGVTHSLVALPLAAPWVGALGNRFFDQQKQWRGDRLRSWIHLAFWALWTHPILDAFTTYGTQLLAPLTSKRFVFDSVAIIDPWFTLPLLLSCLLAYVRLWSAPQVVSRGARLALGWAVFYLAAGFLLSRQAEHAAKQQLASENFQASRVQAATPLFFPVLRRISVQNTDNDFLIGFYSPWSDDPINWTPFLSQSSADIEALLKTREGRVFQWFADGWVQAHQDQERITLFDRRYGLVSVPGATPFRAVADLGPDGRPSKLRQVGMDATGVSLSKEWQAGWNLLRSHGQ